MENKQTAVEWLEYLHKEGILIEKSFRIAKEMEKEQIEDAFQAGKWDWHEHITNDEPSKDLAQYYKETYGK